MIKAENGLGDWYAINPEPTDQTAELRKTLDQRTSQLLNELYHERARLERVVQDACDVIEALADGFKPEDLCQEDCAIIVGSALQFLDTHRAG